MSVELFWRVVVWRSANCIEQAMLTSNIWPGYFILNFLLTMLPFFLLRETCMLTSLPSLGFFFLALLCMYRAYSHGRCNLACPISPLRETQPKGDEG